MDRYQRVEKPRPESSISENEIRITTQGLIRNYISYAISLLQEKRVREIVLKAMGQAISKAVAIVEIIKKRNPGLHQDTTISSVSITDVWEPIEEGLVPLEMTRHVSMISISLSIRALNKNSPGYEPPSHVEQPKLQKYQQPQHYQQQQFPRQLPAQYIYDSYRQGHGRGRGRGRGWSRGGYGAYGGYGNYGGYGGYGEYGHDQENGWNYNWNQGGGRARGGWVFRGAGYERGRVGGRRGYGRGSGRMSGHGTGYQV